MRKVGLFVLLLLGGAGGLWLLASILGGDSNPALERDWDATNPESVTPSTAEPLQAGVRLLKAVIPFSSADLEDGLIPSEALREERDDETRVYETTIGPMALSAFVATRGDRTVVKQLGEAIRVAEEWGKKVAPDAECWTFESLGPLGCHLRHPKLRLVVTDFTVLEELVVSDRDSKAEVEKIRSTAAALMTEVRASTSTAGWMVAALDDFLARLDDPPDPTLEGVDPDFARQVASDPRWLRRVAPAASSDVRDGLVDALRAARSLLPSARFERGAVMLTEFSDAWQERGQHLQLGQASVYVRTPPMAFQSASRRRVLRTCRLLYMPTNGVDLIAEPHGSLRADAFFMREGTPLATWSAKGLGLRYRAWRQAFPRYRLPAVDGHWPPHVPIVGLDGTLHGVGTTAGFLRPPRLGREGEAERFVADAARVLPTPAHLDLLQQYFVRYCHDSPSPLIPLMIGTPKHAADIHQTAEQMLDTTTGGVCRGDCDDFAELCHTIARRQGKLAHVVSLPRHLATVWAEESMEEWRAYVLQTGPTLEFRGATLNDVLRQAYLILAPDEPFDAAQVPLSLRFAGESTRSEFRLAGRVFGDAEHARTMVGVQADWHASRYLRILRTMRDLYKSDDSAEVRHEFAAICDRLGLHAEAADMSARAQAAGRDQESRVLRRIEWTATALRAGRRDEAEVAVRKLLKEELPSLIPELGLRTLSVAIELADALSSDPVLSARVLAHAVDMQLPILNGSIADLLRPEIPAKRWRDHEHHLRLQRVLYDLAWSFIRATESARKKELPKVSAQLQAVARPVDVWLARHALDDVERPEARSGRWGLRAHRRIASEPGFMEQILSAAPLTAAQELEDPSDPSTSTIAVHARSSVRFLAISLIELPSAAAPPDPVRARQLLKLLADATRLQRQLGLQNESDMNLHLRGCAAAALITKDEGSLRDALLELRLIGSRFDTARVARMIGRFARHVDAARWKRVVDTWADVMTNDVNDFRIAWAAHSVGAIKHALAMAALSAGRFKQNEALQEEARLFSRFVANGANPEALRTSKAAAGSGG